MSSAHFNRSAVTFITLDGLMLLSGHNLLLFFILLALHLFIMSSDSLIVYIICSQENLRRPMFAFVAAVLTNSMMGSFVVFPKLLSDLLSGRGFVQLSLSVCLGQTFIMCCLGASSFLLLSAMAFDRYLSICRPLRYAALVSPAVVAALLLLCWLLPAVMVGGATLLASRLPLCRSRLTRLYCDMYTFISLSCGGGSGAALLSSVYGLICSAVLVLLPIVFVLFSYSRILHICLRRSRTFSSKALHTCLPHLIVFVNYSITTGVELLYRRVQGDGEPSASIIASILIMVIPTVMNPVVYGLKMKEIFKHVKQLLSCQKEPRIDQFS